MLGTPKAPGEAIVGEAISHASRRAEEPERETGQAERKGNNGRLTRSDEHSTGVAIFGRESGHALQVRGRTKDSRIQVGQPLALQEIAARPVDGREVEPDGTAGETQTQGGHESCRGTVEKIEAGG